MAKKRKKKIEECSHIFYIIKKSGKKSGIASWKCYFCNKRVKSN